MPINKMDHSVNRMLSFVDKVCYAKNFRDEILKFLDRIKTPNEITGIIKTDSFGKNFEIVITNDVKQLAKNMLITGLQKKADELLKELEGYNKEGYLK